jgi:hypothetical protein
MNTKSMSTSMNATIITMSMNIITSTVIVNMRNTNITTTNMKVTNIITTSMNMVAAVVGTIIITTITTEKKARSMSLA